MPRLCSCVPAGIRSISIALAVLCLIGVAPASLVAREQAPSLAGRASDSRGMPVAQAVVRLVAEDGQEVATTSTDADGRFAFVGPAASCRNCRVDVTRTGFKTASVPVAAAGETMVVLSLAPLLETVVVTATRGVSESPLTGSSVTALDRDTIAERGAPLVAEVLRSTPGVTVVGSGGQGGVTSLYLRGGESDYTKVLLDGIPMNEPGGTFNFSSLTTAGVDRIEIVRGAMSGLFGSDAMAGVIQLFSTRGVAATGPRVNVVIEDGTYGTTRLLGSVSGGAGRWDYAVSGSRFATDNRVANNAHNQHSMTLTVGGPMDAAGRASLRGVARIDDQRTGVPGQTAFGRPDLDAFFDRRDIVAGLSLHHQVTPRWRQRAAVSMSRSTQRSANLIADAPYTPAFEGRMAPFEFFDFTFDSRNRLRRYAVTYQSDWSLGTSSAHTVTTALDVDAQRATLEDRLDATSLPASRDNVGVTAQYQFSGARVNASASVRLERNASFGTAAVPRASVAYRLRTARGTWGDTIVRASAGLGIKEPTILESFSRNFFFLGNADLLPERSHSLDTGLEQRLFGDRARVDVAYFDGRYRNQISMRTIDFSTFQGQYFNIGRTKARGTEVAVEARPAPWFRARFGHTFLASAIVESASPGSTVFQVGAWTFRRPRHSGFLNVGLTRGRVAADVSGVFSGRRVDSDFSSLVPAINESNLPTVWALNVRARVSGALEAFFRVENLSDREYMDPLGYEAWRRTTHAGLRLTF